MIVEFEVCVGVVDILVNNVGIYCYVVLVDMDFVKW